MSTEDASGEWVEVVHRCELPTPGEVREKNADSGSTWKCECGALWELYRGPRERDGSSGLRPTWSAKQITTEEGSQP